RPPTCGTAMILPAIGGETVLEIGASLSSAKWVRGRLQLVSQVEDLELQRRWSTHRPLCRLEQRIEVGEYRREGYLRTAITSTPATRTEFSTGRACCVRDSKPDQHPDRPGEIVCDAELSRIRRQPASDRLRPERNDQIANVHPHRGPGC